MTTDLKKRTDMSSAIELQEVGWPDLLAWIILTQWTLNLVAMSLRTVTWSMLGHWYSSWSPDMLCKELDNDDVGV